MKHIVIDIWSNVILVMRCLIEKILMNIVNNVIKIFHVNIVNKNSKKMILKDIKIFVIIDHKNVQFVN